MTLDEIKNKYPTKRFIEIEDVRVEGAKVLDIDDFMSLDDVFFLQRTSFRRTGYH